MLKYFGSYFKPILDQAISKKGEEEVINLKFEGMSKMEILKILHSIMDLRNDFLLKNAISFFE